MTTTPNPTAEQAERLSMEVLNEYRKVAAWLEAQAATRGPVGDTMHGLAAEALTNLIEHEYSRHTIPLYGMLDLWMALADTSPPEFDEFYAEHGYAETWSRLLDGVRRLRRAHGLLSEGAPSEEQVERAARAYDPEAWAARDKFASNGPGTEAELDLMVEYSVEKARAMLTAAGVAPQEPSEIEYQCSGCAGLSEGHDPVIHAKRQPAPSPDRDKLIAEARGRAVLCSQDAREAMRDTGDIVTRLADALAAQPVQGDAKLLQNSLDPEKVAATLFNLGVSSARVELIASALCEAAKRGELT